MFGGPIGFVYCTFSLFLVLAWSAKVYNGKSWVEVVEEELKVDSDRAARNDLIHVNIVSFRDTRCGSTLNGLFSRSSNPNNLRISLVQFRSHEDDDCLESYCRISGGREKNCKYRSQIKNIVMSQFEYKSLSRGMHIADSEVTDEDYCFNIDSSGDVINKWDSELIKMWEQIGNDYAILTTQLPAAKEPVMDVVRQSANNENEVPHLCQAGYFIGTGGAGEAFTENDNVVQVMNARPARSLTRPLLAPFYSASFSFSKCHSTQVLAPEDSIRCPQLMCAIGTLGSFL